MNRIGLELQLNNWWWHPTGGSPAADHKKVQAVETLSGLHGFFIELTKRP